MNQLQVCLANNMKRYRKLRGLSQEKLAEKISRISVDGKSTLNVVIGSSCGIADEIKSMCHFRLSMSEMTFPHQLARVMILEQIYRAFQINNGGKYHK